MPDNGAWKVHSSTSPYWEIIDTQTGRTVRIGLAGGTTNYYDKAVAEADRRNAKEEAERCKTSKPS